MDFAEPAPRPEWSQDDLDRMLAGFVRDRDMEGVAAALQVMAVRYPDRAAYWREVLGLAVAVGQARHAVAADPDGLRS